MRKIGQILSEALLLVGFVAQAVAFLSLVRGMPGYSWDPVLFIGVGIPSLFFLGGLGLIGSGLRKRLYLSRTPWLALAYFTFWVALVASRSFIGETIYWFIFFRIGTPFLVLGCMISLVQTIRAMCNATTQDRKPPNQVSNATSEPASCESASAHRGLR